MAKVLSPKRHTCRMWSILLRGRAAQYRDLRPGEVCSRMARSGGSGVKYVRF